MFHRYITNHSLQVTQTFISKVVQYMTSFLLHVEFWQMDLFQIWPLLVRTHRKVLPV